MVVEIIMPKMGESIMEGTILKWLKKAGEKIERDEPLLEISTDKVDTEVPAPETGIITKLLFSENDVVEVGKVIALMDTEADAKPESPESEPIKEKSETAPVMEVPAEEAIKESQTRIKETKTTETSKFFSPLVLNIAQKEGIQISELERIQGTGMNGRVTKNDILDYIKNKSAMPEVKEEIKKETEQKIEPKEIVKPAAEPKQTPPVKKDIGYHKSVIDYNAEGISVFEFDNVRQKMAEHMVASAAISPHVNAVAECDMSNVEKARLKLSGDFETKERFKLTYMPFIAEAVVKTLKDFPLVNAVIDDSSVPYKAVMSSRINLGFAVAMENGGLIVPVIKNADSKNLTGLAREINDLGKRARVKKLTLDEIQGGTFTISNYGVFGNIFGTMIINQPQIAILGVGAIKKRPKVIETSQGDFIAIRPMMYLTLSFDHRLIDGALGGKFVIKLAEYLENYSY